MPSVDSVAYSCLPYALLVLSEGVPDKGYQRDKGARLARWTVGEIAEPGYLPEEGEWRRYCPQFRRRLARFPTLERWVLETLPTRLIRQGVPRTDKDIDWRACRTPRLAWTQASAAGFGLVTPPPPWLVVKRFDFMGTCARPTKLPLRDHLAMRAWINGVPTQMLLDIFNEEPEAFDVRLGAATAWLMTHRRFSLWALDGTYRIAASRTKSRREAKQQLEAAVADCPNDNKFADPIVTTLKRNPLTRLQFQLGYPLRKAGRWTWDGTPPDPDVSTTR